MDRKEDNSDTDIYMVPTAGGDSIRLTSSKKPESGPRWSPDGRYLAFTLGARRQEVAGLPARSAWRRRGGDHRLQYRRVFRGLVARQLEARAARFRSLSKLSRC